MHLKLNSYFIAIAGSDGLFPSESTELFKDENDNILVKLPEIATFILSEIKSQILNTKSIQLDEILAKTKENFIDKIEDDTSIGVLISDTFMNEFINLNQNKI